MLHCSLIKYSLQLIKIRYICYKTCILFAICTKFLKPCCSSCQKHLSVYLDKKLNFTNHIKEKNSKANKCIGILRKL